ARLDHERRERERETRRHLERERAGRAGKRPPRLSPRDADGHRCRDDDRHQRERTVHDATSERRLATMRVPPPDGLCTARLPPAAWPRPAAGRSREPFPGSPPPTPSARTSTSSPPPAARTSISSRDAFACLSALATASEQVNQTQRSTSGSKRVAGAVIDT